VIAGRAAGAAWAELAQSVLEGHRLGAEEALSVLESPDGQLLSLVEAAYTVRRHFYGDVVKLNYLVNAKSGVCPEDCHYCSQSRISTAAIDRYQLLPAEEVAARVGRGVALGASTCCIVISARGPSGRELRGVCESVLLAKERHPGLKICACLGLLRDEQAEELRAAGVDRYNHNLNTSRDHYGEICSTHTYADREATVRAVKRAGISPCSGVIVGMGETREQLVDSAFSLRDVGAESIPVNFLLPIRGTPLERAPARLTPAYCLKVLCLFRLVCPDREIRVSAGREAHLGSLQPFSLYPANALFVADYLTEPGQPPEDDSRMIGDLGLQIEPLGAPIGPITG
jgi:biotin synthase